MTLKEIINKFEGFGVSDNEIIRYYYIVNHKESEAVAMLADLASNKIKIEYEYESALKEAISYADVIMSNSKIKLNTRLTLVRCYIEFICNGMLRKNSLKTVKEIFNGLTADDLFAFPVMFLGYLQSEGIGTQFGSMLDRRSKLLEEHDALLKDKN